MYFGTQYYRPPFPRKECWKEDLEHIKALNFNVVKLWAVWNWIERTPGKFDFTELDEMVSLCKEYGLKVMINTIPEGAPYWTSTGQDDSFYETAEGEKLYYSGPANLPSAGWPGRCLDSDKALDMVCNFIYEVSRHYADDENVFCIDVWNEPHLEPMYDYVGKLLCYCANSQQKFREWLKERYETLEKLNQAWFRQYTDWSQIEPPRRLGTAADMIDWRRFWLYNLARYLRARVAAARKGAPKKLIQTHLAYSGYMGLINHGGLACELGDDFLLAKEVDMFGLSAFPLWLMGERHADCHLLNTEIVAEASREKPFYQVELQGGAGKPGILGGLVPSADDVRMWNWNVIAAGGKGVVYWQFKPEPAGLESPGYGQVNFDGSDTPRSLSAGECAARFNNPALSGASRCLSENGIFLSRNADLQAYAAGAEKDYNHSFQGVYLALLDRGIPCRFIHGDYLDKAVSEGVKTLYVPMGVSLSKEETDGLTAFAKAGGTLILECCAGMYGENGELDRLLTFQKDLFGIVGSSVEAVRGDHIPFTVDGREIKYMYYRQMFQSCSKSCKVLAKFSDGLAAVMENAYGNGKVIWFSGFAGLEYFESHDSQTGDYIASYFNPNGYAEVDELSCGSIIMRLLENEKSYIVVCINRTDTAFPVHVTVKGKKEAATVPAKDGVILEFQK